ncbi:hypothetical protein EB796_013397 [Bugula neritina]|uniref:Uncharacterized protein n=1 Tax=Bugula neritina TaxID=10212 RepID=A0A7J7JQY9_BUGNE|nr:hypothetical protein EB796_013397 [Bugula neritina]
MAAVTTATVEDDDIIQLVNDITSCYIDLHNVHIKPTWINLSVLLAYATKLRHSLTHQPTQLNSRAIGYKNNSSEDVDSRDSEVMNITNKITRTNSGLCADNFILFVSFMYQLTKNNVNLRYDFLDFIECNYFLHIYTLYMNLQNGANGTMRPSRRDRTFSSLLKDLSL